MARLVDTSITRTILHSFTPDVQKPKPVGFGNKVFFAPVKVVMAAGARGDIVRVELVRIVDLDTQAYSIRLYFFSGAPSSIPSLGATMNIGAADGLLYWGEVYSQYAGGQGGFSSRLFNLTNANAIRLPLGADAAVPEGTEAAIWCSGVFFDAKIDRTLDITVTLGIVMEEGREP